MNAESIARHGWVLAIQATVVLALGFAIASAVRRRGAAWQTNILRTTLAATLILFVLGPNLRSTARPVWTVPTPAAGPTLRLPDKAVKQQVQHVAATPQVVNSFKPAEIPLPENPPAAVSLRDVAVIVWASGVAIGLLWVLVGVVSLAKLRLRASRNGDQPVRDLAEQLSRQIGIQVPRLLSSAKVSSPFVVGVLRPTIFMPADACAKYDDEQLRAILVHELIHVQHRDCLWGWIARLAGVVAWPHPLIWLLQRRLHDISEELCDQAVLKTGLRPTNYADCLVRIAELASPTRTERLIGIGVVPIRSTLGRRISLVLDSSRNTVTRVSLSGRLTIACCICFSVAAIAIAIVPHRTAGSSTVQGGKTKSQVGDPAATALMRSVRENYSNLTSFSADVQVQEGSAYQNRRLSLIYKRPGFAKVTVMERDRMEVAETLYAEPNQWIAVTPHHPNSYLYQKRSKGWSWYTSGLLAGMNEIHVQGLGIIGMLGVDMAVLRKQFPQMADSDKTPWRFGPEVNKDGVRCQTLISKTDNPGGTTAIQTVAIGKADHLVRNSTFSFLRNGKESSGREESFSHIRTNFDVDQAALTFHPNSNFKAVEKVPYALQANAPPAVAAMEKMLQTAKSVSFVVEEVAGNDSIDMAGNINTHSSLHRLTVQIAPPERAHIKLELRDYSHQNLEVWAIGGQEQVVEKGNVQRYLSRPLQKDMDLLSEVGIPAGACRTGFSLIQQIRTPNSIGFFRGAQGTPTTFEGEPVDVVVQGDLSQDEFGFPGSSKGSTTMLISQRDHMLRKIETKMFFEMGGKPASNVSTEVIREVKIDAPIPDSVFTFKPDPGMTPTSDVNDLEPFRLQSQTAIDETLTPGQHAPNFISTLIDGTPISLSQFRGKVVFLHGWTFGIYNYVTELPLYEKIYKKYKGKGLVMLGIPYAEKDDRKSAIDWLKKNSITHPQVFDGKGSKGGIQSIYKMGGRPFAFIINRDGTVYGKAFLVKDIEDLVKKALAKKVP